jgi:hypothetical protein
MSRDSKARRRLRSPGALGKSHLPSKLCVQCGRPMVWRRAWAAVWDQVLTCSQRCRRERRAKPR